MSLRHDIRVGMFLLVLGLLVLSMPVEAKQGSPHPTGPPSELVLAVEGNRLSLKAQAASLDAVLSAMGKQMDMEILGENPKREAITTNFEGLSLAEAMQHLGLNYGYQLDRAGETPNTKKLFILPRRTQTALSQSQPDAVEPTKEPVKPIVQSLGEIASLNEKKPGTDKPSRPAPFQFQFDPSAFAE